MRAEEHNFVFSDSQPRATDLSGLLATFEKVKEEADTLGQDFNAKTRQGLTPEALMKMRLDSFIDFFAETFMSEDERLRYEISFIERINTTFKNLLEQYEAQKLSARLAVPISEPVQSKPGLIIPGR